MAGRHPLPILTCKAPGCGAPIIFLANRETGRGVAVAPDSLSEEDRSRIEETGRSYEVDYDVLRHRRHRYACKVPEFQPERGGRKA